MASSPDIDYAAIEIDQIEREAKHFAVGVLMSGSNNGHDGIVQRVDRYLREHYYLDPARWTWRVFTPWRGNILPPWGMDDVRVELWERSAVERLAALADS